MLPPMPPLNPVERMKISERKPNSMKLSASAFSLVGLMKR